MPSNHDVCSTDLWEGVGTAFQTADIGREALHDDEEKFEVFWKPTSPVIKALEGK